jgi:hypothetical protein
VNRSRREEYAFARVGSEGWPAGRSSVSEETERRLVPEVGIEPTRGVNPTGF